MKTITMKQILEEKFRAMIIECIHRDIEDLDDNLRDEPDDVEWNETLKMARYVLKKLHHKGCRTSWFSANEVDYIVGAVIYWQDN